jgi:tRNA-splicing ligase RtcB
MKWVRETGGSGIPVKSWCEAVDPLALKQALNLANHPAIAHHVALMPDCHVGYGMPIGGVVAARDALIPNAVGVDIGCGMAAVETDLPAERFAEMSERRAFMARVKARTPTGEGRSHGSAQAWEGFERFCDESPRAGGLWPSALDRANLGTLGGGNHFIELQASEEGFIWLMLHSGSRNLGQRVASHYHAEALRLCGARRAALPDPDLAFLPADSGPGQDYLRDMAFALAYALENRRRMMAVCQEALLDQAGAAAFAREVNIHHNYAALESHFGHRYFVHRKGATRAQAGEVGIIPGSMGAPSYIVRGLGNPESFTSCSHGAGRAMGRAEANRRLTEDACNRAMAGIAFDRWGQARAKWNQRRGPASDLSEAPQAYKDIEAVLEAQRDLVEPLVKLRPLAVVKG